MIYLDHAAATPVDEKVLASMLPYFADNFFNPSSPYLPAQNLKDEYKAAKDRLAHTIGAKGTDLIITSGATESNTLALKDKKVLALATEHPSVLVHAQNQASAVKSSEITGGTTENVIKVDKTGLIDLADLKAKLTPDIEVVSVSLAGGELGTIQPLADIAKILEEARTDRLAKNNQTPLLLHSDASQALALMDINVARLGVDLLTLNSPKVYGPKGVGALYVARHLKLEPLIMGGGQERGLRSGTENVPGLIGFATAAELAHQKINQNRKKYEKLAKILKEELEKSPVPPLFLGNKKHHLASFVPVSFPGIDAERLIYRLEEEEIYLSTGAACAASKGEKSKTLTAINLTDVEIAGSLRISLGQMNTGEQMHEAGQAIVEAINQELKNAQQ